MIMLKQQSGTNDGISAGSAGLAVEEGPQQLQKFLEKHNITIDHFINGQRTLLMDTIHDPNPELLRTIFLFNPDLFLLSNNRHKETVIHTTARVNKPKPLRVLLEEADKKGYLLKAVNCRDGNGNTPLLSASRFASSSQDGLEETIDVLLEFGADPTIANDAGELPIKFLNGKPDLQQKLTAQIEKQKQQKLAPTIPTSKPQIPPKPNQRRNSLEANRAAPTAFFQNMGPSRQKTPSPPQDESLTRSSGSAEETTKSSPKAPMDARSFKSDEATRPTSPVKVPEELQRRIDEQLIIACETGQHEIAENLLKNLGANPNAVSESEENSMTALAIAVLNNDKRMVTLLLDHKADINLGKTTPLGAAIFLAKGNGNELTLFLLERGANPNVRSMPDIGSIPDNRYPMHQAANDNNTVIANALFKSGADVNLRLNENMSTPLIVAVCSEHLEMVKWLVEHGADLSLSQPCQGGPATALTFAECSENQEIINFLKPLYSPKDHSSAHRHRINFRDHEASDTNAHSDSKKCVVM